MTLEESCERSLVPVTRFLHVNSSQNRSLKGSRLSGSQTIQQIIEQTHAVTVISYASALLFVLLYSYIFEHQLFPDNHAKRQTRMAAGLFKQMDIQWVR